MFPEEGRPTSCVVERIIITIPIANCPLFSRMESVERSSGNDIWMSEDADREDFAQSELPEYTEKVEPEAKITSYPETTQEELDIFPKHLSLDEKTKDEVKNVSPMVFLNNSRPYLRLMLRWLWPFSKSFSLLIGSLYT